MHSPRGAPSCSARVRDRERARVRSQRQTRSDIRERYVRPGLAHLLSISGLHVGFIAAWLALISGSCPSRRALASPRRLFCCSPIYAARLPGSRGAGSGAMLALAEVARLRERVVAPRASWPSPLWFLLQDPWPSSP